MSPPRDQLAILFRCDASSEIGFGHLVRCLALADELRKRNARVGFVLGQHSLGAGSLREQGYPVFQIPTDEAGYAARLEAIIGEFGARLLAVDVRDSLFRQHLDHLRAKGCLVALLDDISDRRFAADLSFYPPVPQVKRIDWSGVQGKYYIGWEWTILRSQFTAPVPACDGAGESLLITMGGSDPAGMTLQAVRAVELLPTRIRSVVVIGPGFRRRKELAALLAKARQPFRVEENVQEMRALMLQATIALCAYGMTAFELAATGVPALYLCLTDDHVESASALEDAGVGKSLGLYSAIADEQLAAAARDLLSDPGKRSRIAKLAPTLIDGLGARRIAQVLVNAVRQ